MFKVVFKALRNLEALKVQRKIHFSISCKFSTTSLSSEPSKTQTHMNEETEPVIAREIFSRAPKIEDSTFYSLIESYANSCDFYSLEKVLYRMKHERRVLIEKKFIVIFKAYGKARLLDKAVNLFERMKDDFQCRPTIKSFNTLLNFIIKEREFGRAIEFYSRVVDSKSLNISQDVLSFNLIIKAMCKLGLVDRAVEMFKEMSPKNCSPDVYTYSTLIVGLCKENRIDEAISLLDEMECKPDIVVYGALIDGFCQERKMDKAEKIMSYMSNDGIKPNHFIYSSLMKGFFQVGDSNKAILLWKEMVNNDCLCDEYLYNVLIDGLCKNGNVREALMVWKHVLARGFKRDVVSYSSIIHGLCNAGLVEQGMKFFYEMRCLGPESQPDVITYNILLIAFCKQGNISNSIALLNSMLDQGCNPNASICEIFLRVLREQMNPPQDGREFLDELVVHLCKRQRISGASLVVQVMLQKFLPPKASTWARVVQELWKPSKVQVTVDWCWMSIHA